MPYSTKDYSGAGFEYVVDKKYRQPLCFGSKVPREVLPRRGPELTGFMRRTGGEYPPYSCGLATSHPRPQKAMKMLTIPKSARMVEGQSYQPPLRAPSPPPARPPHRYIPFNSSSKRSGKTRDGNIPGPGTYNPVYKKRQMKFNHSFGGKTIVVPAVDIKCVPYNLDACVLCSTDCSKQGDYWHQDNKQFLCRACYERQHVTRSKFTLLQLEDFKPIRDCFFAHHHEMYNNSIKLIGVREIRKRILKEAYLAQYFSNIRVQKYK